MATFIESSLFRVDIAGADKLLKFSSNNFAFYDEVLPNFGYFERPLVLVLRAYMVKADLKIIGRKIMKFLHEMMPIFRTEFSEFSLRSYLQDGGLQFPPSCLQKHNPSYRSSFYKPCLHYEPKPGLGLPWLWTKFLWCERSSAWPRPGNLGRSEQVAQISGLGQTEVRLHYKNIV